MQLSKDDIIEIILIKKETVEIKQCEYEACKYRITMKDGGDYVCEFVCCGAADYSEEFWVYKAAENGPNIVYINGLDVLPDGKYLSSGLVHPGPRGIELMSQNLIRIISENL